MRKNRKMIILLGILLGVFFAINTSLVWKWMYPIKYENEVLQASNQFQVNPYLVLAIIRAESDFSTDKISKKGAVGLMQVMPDTANWVVNQANFEPITEAELFHAKTNIEIGTWYLAFLLNKFGGDQVKAIAAYNAGPGKVSEWIDRNLWDGTIQSVQDIPFGETRNYVQRVVYFQERYQKVYDTKLQ
ncbi:MAG TPA: lytic transglycosylase domain-containing protein [Candidatus Bathyarchaeia archaeon]|nr:lytic transglycosylase domain-containing protein [Candidatus Bathyarchaeia archaeon]